MNQVADKDLPQVKFEELPQWMQESIKKQRKEYVDYFDSKWAEGPAFINFDLPLKDDQTLPESIIELLDITSAGVSPKINLQGGCRLIGLSTRLGGIALYEVEVPTKVPLDEKGNFAICTLKNLKLHAPEIFWRSGLLYLDANGGVNLVTFLYAFGLPKTLNPNSSAEELNAQNMANRVEFIADTLVKREGEAIARLKRLDEIEAKYGSITQDLKIND